MKKYRFVEEDTRAVLSFNALNKSEAYRILAKLTRNPLRWEL